MANSSATTKQHSPLPTYRRVVVKAGTNVLTSDGARLDRVAMATLVGEVASAQHAGVQVVLVTSGAVAAGREVLTKPNDAGGVGLTLTVRGGYDHSYYFISTFLGEHVAWHGERLRG